MQSTNYEGWKNYETWNVSLWINNDEPLYRAAVKFMQVNPDKNNPYKAFIVNEGLSPLGTPDDVEWISDLLDYKELNAMMEELNE